MKPFSASEIDTARGCMRKWAFRYASDTPKPLPKASAAQGSALHAIAEAYLRDGTPPPAEGLGALVRAGLPFLPPPGTGEVERRLQVDVEGLPFTAVFDWAGRANLLPGHEHVANDFVGILDHKTSKDPRRYGLWTDDDMLAAPQPIVYRLAFGPAPVVNRWLYYPTGSGRQRVKPSDHMLPYTATRGAFQRVVLPVVDNMLKWRGRKVDPLTVPGNPGHCDAYGGCDYRAAGLCNITASEHARHLFGGNDMPSIWDNLNPNGPAATTGAPVVQSQTAPAAFAFQQPAVVTTPTVPVDPAPAVAEKPKRRRKAAETEIVTYEDAAHLGVGARGSETVTIVPEDTLTRIGRALIAAGKALVGESQEEIR